MTAPLHRLCTDASTPWARYNAIRGAFMERPTPARMDARLDAFKPFYIKLVGKGWQELLPAAMERERAACVALLNAARGQGGRHASPP
jgi:hypothetical protein